MSLKTRLVNIRIDLNPCDTTYCTSGTNVCMAES